TFLDTIQAQTHVNFIVTEGLEAKRVTAFLQNVSVREALQVLLEIKGLTYQQIGKSNTYVVAPRFKTVENLITRIYTLNYIPLIPLGGMSNDVAAITPQSNTTNVGGQSPGGGGGAATAPSQSGGGGGGSTEGVPIISVLKSVLSRNGQVALEPRTNSLVVTDIPEVFPQVEQIVAELDRKAPQVMIEAQIVEIDSTRTRDIGFEWGGANGQLAQFTGGQRDTTFPLNLGGNLSNTHFFDPFIPGISNLTTSIGGSGATGSSSTGGGSSSGASTSSNVQTRVVGNIKSSLLDLTSLQITLRALVARSEARFLGKPKILTLNNKPAIMQIATEQAVGRQINNSSGGSLTTQTASAERYTTGLIMKVTPQINKEGYITMLIQPSFTDVQVSPISTQAQPVYDPVTRGASTLVRVRNGQTLVIGGLLQSTETNVVRKVPLLGYIPLLGWFFTSSESLRKNTDLVVFLTPTIVSD
ncbi:MAG: secretin N-terminal domain-containing protein, partial [Elusimicrobia bacterium]|nr:secretin N-terminal domain-containing protein [Elusimicrobiota bacterium]